MGAVCVCWCTVFMRNMVNVRRSLDCLSSISYLLNCQSCVFAFLTHCIAADPCGKNPLVTEIDRYRRANLTGLGGFQQGQMTDHDARGFKEGGPSQLIWEPELLPYSTSAQAWCEDMKRPDDWERTFQWSRRHFVCNSQMSVMKHWNLILENYQHNTGHCETRCKHAVYIYLIYQTERNADMTVCMCIFLFQFHQVLWERKKNG